MSHASGILLLWNCPFPTTHMHRCKPRRKQKRNIYLTNYGISQALIVRRSTVFTSGTDSGCYGQQQREKEQDVYVEVVH